MINKALIIVLIASSLAVCDKDKKPVAAKINIRQWVSTNQYPLDSLAGQPYLLEFWATWCTPCLDNLPILERFYKQYSDDGLRIIGLSVDDNSEVVEKFMTKHKVPYPIALDAGTDRKYGVSGIPAAVLVDAAGFVVWIGHPADKELEKAIKKVVEISPKSVIAGLDLSDFKDITLPLQEGRQFTQAYKKLITYANGNSSDNQKAKKIIEQIDHRLRQYLLFAKSLEDQEQHIAAINVYFAVVKNYGGTPAAAEAVRAAVELKDSL